MSLEYLLAGKYVINPVGPMARLALIAMGDCYSHVGPHFNLPQQVALWAAQPEPVVKAGLLELVAADLLFVDRGFRDGEGRPATWLAYIDGWEDVWEEMLWQRLPVERRPLPAALRRAVLDRDGHACVICGSTTKIAVDHIHPVSRGGMNVEANLQVLCRSHNSSKSNKVNGRRVVLA